MFRFGGLSHASVLVLTFSLAYGQTGSLLKEESSWEQGKRYLAEGKAKEARAIFEGLIRRYPQEPDLYLFLSIALLRARDPQGAESHLKRLLKLAPNHVEARTLLGWIRLEIHGDYASAIEEYRKVVELRPDYPEAHNNLGVAFKKKGDLDGAIESFTTAVKLQRGYSEAWSNRGWVYAEQRKWREARNDFEQALKINPNDHGALYGLSRVLRESRDYAGAQKALGRLVAEAPNFIYWLEWGELQLVRYYWILLVAAAAGFLHSRYRRVRRGSHGDGDNQKA